MKKNIKKSETKWTSIRGAVLGLISIIDFPMIIAILLVLIIVYAVTYAVCILILYIIAKLNGIEDIILITASGDLIELLSLGLLFNYPLLYHNINRLVAKGKVKLNNKDRTKFIGSSIIGGVLIFFGLVLFSRSNIILTNEKIYLFKESANFTLYEYSYDDVSEVKIEYIKNKRNSYLTFNLIIDNEPIDIWGGEGYITMLTHSESKIRKIYSRLKGKVKVTVIPDGISEDSKLELERILQ
ncbi:hypothetical protein [Leptospira koniambonensis]|uniref:hypothetical protein n=1 Tax=Leptospira koniambonensis TaxID=2484950 RepID=UPI003EBE5C3E